MIRAVLSGILIMLCFSASARAQQNDGIEPVYLQVMAGAAQPELMGYADPELWAKRDEHLRRKGLTA